MKMAASSGILNFSCILIFFLRDVSGQNAIPDTVQEFHACVGTTAYIPWPLNIVARSEHGSTVITLSFQHRRSERRQAIATFNKHRKLNAQAPFRKRLVVSKENSGLFLKHVSLDDAGIFIAQARMSDGDVWTRSTNLIVHLRPIVIDEKLNLSIVHTNKGRKGRGDCITLSCGKLEYVGYPPAKIVWRSETEILASETAMDDSYSLFEICSPFRGPISCSIAGFSSACTFDHMVSISLDLPGLPKNATTVSSGTTTSEYLLMIGMPALAIGVPLLVLGIWLLTHFLTYKRRSREHHEHSDKDHSQENHQTSPSATLVEINSPPSTRSVDDLTMTQSVASTDREDDELVLNRTHSPIKTSEETLVKRPNTPHRPFHTSDDDEDEEEEEDEEDDSDENLEEDHKESQPLMEDSITQMTL